MAIPSTTVDALTPKIFVAFAEASQPTYAAIQALDKDYSMEAVRKGSVIDTPVDDVGDPNDVEDVVPGLTPSSGAPSADYNYHSMKLDKYKRVRFTLTHREVYELTEGIVPSAIRTKAQSLGRYLNQEVCRLYRQIPYYVKSSGLFGSDNLATVAAIDKQAAIQEMPMGDRRLILAPGPFSTARTNARLMDADKTGIPPGMNDHAYFASRGYRFFLDQQVQTHTTGDIADENDFKLNGAVSVGDRSITIDAIAHTLKDGDLIITATGGTAIGCVKGDHAAQTTNVPLYHPAINAVADDTLLNILAATDQNILTTPGGLKIAVRTIQSPVPNPNEHIEVDPVTGMPVVMSVWQGDDMVLWTFKILFGLAVVQPHRCMRVVA